MAWHQVLALARAVGQLDQDALLLHVHDRTSFTMSTIPTTDASTTHTGGTISSNGWRSTTAAQAARKATAIRRWVSLIVLPPEGRRGRWPIILGAVRTGTSVLSR